MKCVVISDTHANHNKLIVPDGDVLFHCGDFSAHGKISDTNHFLNWFSEQPHKHKVLIAGNHDWLFEKENCLAKSMVSSFGNICYLENSEVVIEGLKIWGSPFSPFYNNWAFNKFRGEDIRRCWDLIPDDIDILVTHGPPMYYLDYVPRSDLHVGCEDLMYTVCKIKPKYHLFGHVHEGYGQTSNSYGTTFINASIMDGNYSLVNKPILFEI